MVVGILSLEFFLPQCNSLKSKRRIIRSIQDRIRSRFNIAVAEVDHQDLWQRAVLGFVTVSGSRKVVESTLSKIVDSVEKMGYGELINIRKEII